MIEAIIITPVKDSLDTTRLTVEALVKTKADIDYYVFNDFFNIILVEFKFFYIHFYPLK